MKTRNFATVLQRKIDNDPALREVVERERAKLKPKPFRGWAVFTSNGIWNWTICSTRSAAIERATSDYLVNGSPATWDWLKERHDAVCRRVVVTVTAAAPQKRTK